MADPAAPTVPDAQGVPALGPNAKTPATGTDATADGSTITVAASVSWGITDTSGTSIFPTGGGPDSYHEASDSKAFNVPNYPVDDGGFQSYNKAERPGELHLVLNKMGTPPELQAFRQIIARYCASTDLLYVVTPGWTFRRYNMTERAVQRPASRGVGLIQVQLTFVEVRTDATTSFSSSATATPAGADTVATGSVQTTTPNGAQTPGSSPQ